MKISSNFQIKGFALKCYRCDSIRSPRCINSTAIKEQQPQDCVVSDLLGQGQNFFNNLQNQFGLGNSVDINNAVKATCLKTVYKNGKQTVLSFEYIGATEENKIICFWIYLGTNSVIIRECALKYENKDACAFTKDTTQRAGINGYEYCSTCDQDGCNGANANQLFYSTIVFGVLFCTARLFV